MNIEIEMHEKAALQAACRRLRLELKENQKVRFYDGTQAEGIAIKLPGWKYPIVVKNDGTVAYDNYNGRWGDISELNKLKAYYGIEKAKIEARKKGYDFIESYDRINKKLKLRIIV